MKYITMIVLGAFSLTFSGCAINPLGGQAFGGGASYKYTRLADGSVSLEATSARDLKNLALGVDKDGALVVGVGQTSGVSQALGVLDSAIKRIPALPVPPALP